MESGTGLDDTGTEKFSFERKTADFFFSKKISFEKLFYAIWAYCHHIWRKSTQKKNLLKARAKSSTESLMPMDSMMPPSAGA